MFEIQNLTVEFGGKKIVDDISFEVQEGQWLMIAGPNGAGKSTIVNAISQGVAYKGNILFDGKNLAHCKAQELAKNIGILSQNHNVGYSFSVEEVVRLGRYAYSKGMFAEKAKEDEEKVRKALEMTGMLSQAKQSVLTLSGGELQRTFLAQLFAQDPKMLILDEPTNHLDLVYQKQVFELIREWIKDTGRTVISVVHDLNLAKCFGTQAILLEKGKKVAGGAAEDVFTREYLKRVYSMDVYEWMKTMLSQWKD